MTTVLSNRGDSLVVRVGEVVVKGHSPEVDPVPLAQRLAMARHPDLGDTLLAPVPIAGGQCGGLAARLADRWITVWPTGSPLSLDGDPAEVPWRSLGALLARVHRVAPPTGFPAAGGPARVGASVRRLRTAVDLGQLSGELSVSAATVLAASAELPDWALGLVPPPPERSRALCHGDVHLGQLVRVPPGDWLLLDVDDLGVGDPVWDLARPAAWFAAGLLPTSDWAWFLRGYLAEGGPAVSDLVDPWPALDVPARAVTTQSAANVVFKAGRAGTGLDEFGRTLVTCCHGMVGDPGYSGSV